MNPWYDLMQNNLNVFFHIWAGKGEMGKEKQPSKVEKEDGYLNT